MVGHVHLSTNVYQDLHEIIASVSMNLIVAIGFGKVWQQGFVIRKVSKFITGTSEDAVMPIPVFYDPKTGEILQDTLPKELRDAQPENNLRLVKPDNAN